MTPAPARPRQVTFAGWMIMIGSAIVVFSAFDRISSLRSIESQESVANFLSEPPGDGLGLSVDQVLDLIQLLSVIAGACAAAAAILGFWVLKGSKQARVGLAVLAIPLLITGFATGGFMSSLVAVAAVMLWIQPARNWFEGRPAPTPPVAPAMPPPVAPPVETETPPQQAEPVPWPTPYATRRPLSRPPAVVWACVLTWVGSGIVLVGLGLTVLVLAASPDLLFEELHKQNPDLADQGMTDGEIRAATFVTAGLFLPWCVVAAGFAVQAFRRVPWGRRALLICASVAGAVSLLGMFASAVMIIPFVATVATVALLSRPEVRAWFDTAR